LDQGKEKGSLCEGGGPNFFRRIFLRSLCRSRSYVYPLPLREGRLGDWEKRGGERVGERLTRKRKGSALKQLIRYILGFARCPPSRAGRPPSSLYYLTTIEGGLSKSKQEETNLRKRTALWQCRYIPAYHTPPFLALPSLNKGPGGDWGRRREGEETIDKK